MTGPVLYRETVKLRIVCHFLQLTVTSVIIGVLLAILFGGANAYLGLRVGMTVSASIPCLLYTSRCV